MISRQHRCLFVHIPKVAGQSVEHFFLDLLGMSWETRAPLLLKPNPDPDLGPESLAHLTAPEYVKYGYLNADEFKRFYKFSFVRNPWDRLVSEYHYREYHKEMSFKEFVLTGLPEADGYSDAYRHILPQHEFLYEDGNRCLVDFVGSFENLQRDFDHVCGQLGIARRTLPHVNGSVHRGGLSGWVRKHLRLDKKSRSRKHYSEYYDDELREAVAEMYATDIKLFGYRFQQGSHSSKKGDRR